MKLYIIPSWYSIRNDESSTSYFREQAQALSERGNDVTVINIRLLSISNIGKKKFISKKIWQDGNVRTILYETLVPIIGKLASLQEKYISSLYYKIIKNQIEKDVLNGLGKPDLIHAHISHNCGFYCIKAKQKCNVPLVVTEHFSGLLIGNIKPREYDRVKETINQSDAFIFVGTNLQQKVVDKLNIQKKTFFIPNMVDENNFYISDNPKRNDSFTFLTACGLKKNKSVDLVIKAFHQTFADSEKVKLIIAGDGVERLNLEKLVCDLGENQRISFFGKYSKRQSSELFANSNAFVLTSQIETFGIVYVEALLSGVPCIGTKGQGPEDIINESNGFKVQYGDIEELSNKMRILYDSGKKFDSQKLRNDAIANFSKETICNKIEKIYQYVLERENNL